MSATHSGHVAVAACFSLNRSQSAHKSGLKTMAEATRFVFYLPVGLGPSFVSAFFFAPGQSCPPRSVDVGYEHP